MTYTLQNRTLHGKYQWLWLRWFDLLYILGITIRIGGGLKIIKFNVDIDKLKYPSGSYFVMLVFKELLNKK